MAESNVFEEEASSWWDEKGPFAMLHRMNSTRMEYITKHIKNTLMDKHLNVLDIGCGGGLICEPFARLGFNVTGIDLSATAIQVAHTHALGSGLAIDYRHQDIFSLQTANFDVITALEILEHVDNPVDLLAAAVEKLKPGGLIFISTLDKTIRSYIEGIWIAERIMSFAPMGTHSWDQFLKPSEIILPLQKMGIEMINISGMEYSGFKKKWNLTEKLKTNYICVGRMVGNTGFEPVTL
jgi:2-polyprenyl-6-hydroxyphenyl methylase / 3-demethylubiquinone-9 3-methyltransferase